MATVWHPCPMPKASSRRPSSWGSTGAAPARPGAAKWWNRVTPTYSPGLSSATTRLWDLRPLFSPPGTWKPLPSASSWKAQVYHGIVLAEFLTELGPKLKSNRTSLEAYQRIKEVTPATPAALPEEPSLSTRPRTASEFEFAPLRQVMIHDGPYNTLQNWNYAALCRSMPLNHESPVSATRWSYH